LKNTTFKDNALYLNGLYEYGSPDRPGYSAQCETTALHYDAFTVALRFNAESFSGTERTLLVGGRGYRWFTLSRTSEGRLEVGLNNQRFVHTIDETRLDANRWYNVVCGVDLGARKIVTFLDGKQVAEIALPADFQLQVTSSAGGGEFDKVWTFTNYSNGGV